MQSQQSAVTVAGFKNPTVIEWRGKNTNAYFSERKVDLYRQEKPSGGLWCPWESGVVCGEGGAGAEGREEEETQASEGRLWDGLSCTVGPRLAPPSPP